MTANSCSWGKSRRLLRPAQFAAVFDAGSFAWRWSGRWLALSVHCEGAEAGGETPAGILQFGLMVPKRCARRAVVRNMVKRVIREATRVQTSQLLQVCGARRVAAVFRLRANLPAADALSWAVLKAQLADETRWLLRRLSARLQQAPSGPRVAGGAARGGLSAAR